MHIFAKKGSKANLLASPLQSNGDTTTSKSLSGHSLNYDIVFVRVTCNHSGTEALTVPFYIFNSTQGYGQIIRLNSFVPEGYYAYVYVEIGDTYVSMRCPYVKGWLTNQIWIEQVTGLKLLN